MTSLPVPALIAAAFLTGCTEDGVAEAEVESADEEQVREKLGLPADVELQTTVFVGRRSDGETNSPGRIAMPSMFPDWSLLCGDPRRRRL